MRTHLRTSRGIACGIGHRDSQITSTTDPDKVTCRACLKTSIHAAIKASAALAETGPQPANGDQL